MSQGHRHRYLTVKPDGVVTRVLRDVTVARTDDLERAMASRTVWRDDPESGGYRLSLDTSRLYAELARAAQSTAVIRAVARDSRLNPDERWAKLTAQMQVRADTFMREFEWNMQRLSALGWSFSALSPGSSADPALLSPDAARWTPEDDG